MSAIEIPIWRFIGAAVSQINSRKHQGALQCEELSQGGVGVGVGGARHGRQGGEFGVAERREDARQAGHDERQDEGGTRLVVGADAGQDEDAGPDDPSSTMLGEN